MIIKVAPHTIAQLLMGVFAIETFMDASKFPRVGGGGGRLGSIFAGYVLLALPYYSLLRGQL